MVSTKFSKYLRKPYISFVLHGTGSVTCINELTSKLQLFVVITIITDLR